MHTSVSLFAVLGKSLQPKYLHLRYSQSVNVLILTLSADLLVSQQQTKPFPPLRLLSLPVSIVPSLLLF